jgi:branched-subunit amino acid ABC-type transport system permease component
MLGLDEALVHPWWRLIYLLFSMIVVSGVFAFLQLTTFGMVVRAGMHDRETVGLLGINVERRFTIFGMQMSGYSGFYFCAVLLIIGFFISRRIFRSPFGLELRAIKSNQTRMVYTGFNTRPYLFSSW